MSSIDSKTSGAISELMFEIYSEEIPARFHRKAEEDARSVLIKLLDENGSKFEDVNVFVSSRRVSAQIKQFAVSKGGQVGKKKGPKVGAPETALNAFLAANNKRIEDLTVIDGNYYVDAEVCCVLDESVISGIVESFILRMTWPKSMRWYLWKYGTLSAQWVRPIRSIICIHNRKAVKALIKCVGIETGCVTHGHRSLHPDKIEIYDFDDYQDKLRRSYVIIDPKEKMKILRDEATKAAIDVGCTIKEDLSLFGEIIGLVDFPFCCIGVIDEKFMELPPDIMSTYMKRHQKYIPLFDEDYTAAPFFCAVSNVPVTNEIKSGFEKVLNARLTDALFFFKEDQKTSLTELSKKLSSIVFYEDLGTVEDKISRLTEVAETDEERRTFSISKADLLTLMVGELPEIQGVVGGIYARIQGESESICTAIGEHYRPLGPEDPLPSSDLGSRISFLDKLDTLVGFIGIGVLPTGSKDPFSLRRLSIGVIRIICDSERCVMRGKSIYQYIEKMMNSYQKQNVVFCADAKSTIMKFLIERFKVYAAVKANVPSNCIDAVLSCCSNESIDFNEAMDKSIRLESILRTQGFETILCAYKRACGILESDQKASGERACTLPLFDLQFDNESMSNVQRLLSQEKCSAFDVASSVAIACENVLILDPDEATRCKNISLLSHFVQLVRKEIGDLSLI